MMLISLGGGLSFHLGGTKKKDDTDYFLRPVPPLLVYRGSKEDEAVNWCLMYEMVMISKLWIKLQGPVVQNRD